MSLGPLVWWLKEVHQSNLLLDGLLLGKVRYGIGGGGVF